MPRILMVLVLSLIVAPFALATETPADLAADTPELVEEVSLEEILAETEADSVEQTGSCIDGCNSAADCEAQDWNGSCSYGWICQDPGAQNCSGTCFCC